MDIEYNEEWGEEQYSVPLCFLSNPSKFEQIHNVCRQCEFNHECLPEVLEDD